MPVLEFTLDATSPYRVQVHLNTHRGPVSVMVNHNVLGSLLTVEEQHNGKDFRLPDASLLHVSINDGRAQVWRNGQPLRLASTSSAPLALENKERHWSGGVIAMLVLNMLIVGILIVWCSLQAYFATFSSNLFFPLVGLSLIGLFGLIGLFVLLAWKRWGFYLVACYVLANMVGGIYFGIIDYRTFVPLVGLVLLYIVLRSSGLWRRMS